MTSPRDFGWWIESTDEEVYGPVTRETLGRFLQQGIISANTAVRHCTDAAPAAVIDLGVIEGVDLSTVKRTGDTLSQSWPRRKRERLALAASDVECAYHRRPAVLTCIRCLAPYCSKCQMRGRRRTHYMCKKCHASMFNRRFFAFMGDSILLNGLPTWVAMGVVAAVGTAAESALALVYGASAVGNIAFVIRDPLMGGAGPGKRILGLRVVKHADGVTPLSYGQSFVRWLGHLIPIFNLVDAQRAYGDPFLRRFGDSWANTRVLDAPGKLEKARSRVARKLEKKGIDYRADSVIPLEEFARIDG
jgi:uncharacterized RDD family membrane protein YckC